MYVVSAKKLSKKFIYFDKIKNNNKPLGYKNKRKEFYKFFKF